MALQIHPGFKRSLSVNFVKADGTPGTIHEVPVWIIEPSDTSVLTIAEDGMSAELAWAAAGTGVLTVSADGDLGSGVFPITLTETYEFLAELGAVGGTLVSGEEVPV